MNSKKCKLFRRQCKVLMAKWPDVAYKEVEHKRRVTVVTKAGGEPEQVVVVHVQRVLDNCKRKAYKNIKNAYRQYSSGGYRGIRRTTK